MSGTWLGDWSMTALLRGSPFAFLRGANAFLRGANDILGAEVVDGTMLVRYKRGRQLRDEEQESAFWR